jgi:uncharacterized repeat protein (TIGR03803 family)
VPGNAQFPDSVLPILSRMSMATAILFVLTVVATPSTQAQTFSVLHNFTGGGDGGVPVAGVTMDAAGNLYGTTYLGGAGYGTVYQLRRTAPNWLFNILVSFDWTDGANSQARVVFGPEGFLYGTTQYGGRYGGGVIFKLGRPARPCITTLCPWTETVLYRFPGGLNGANPTLGDVIFDQAGNMYNTAGRYCPGCYGVGIVYEQMPPGSWQTQTILHSFSVSDGQLPLGGVIFDSAGNLYGTTYGGGRSEFGTVYELTKAGSGWTESLLHTFTNGSDGTYPIAGLISDQSGNLYGAAANSRNGGGTVFELTPSDGGWTFSVLHSFTYTGDSNVCGPQGPLVMDAVGNLYGTTYCDGAYNLGNVFKLTHLGGGWTYTSLHDFTGGSDGAKPVSNVILDGSGNLYGTASGGGNPNCDSGYGCGVVWEITP